MSKQPWKIDVPVLIIFFARPDILKVTFERVREAKPSKLLLWQDGPRKNRPDDVENIQKCREIVSNIDWECEVYTNYHEENMGCDPSTHYSHKWAFTIVDKCIILEDDVVPSLSFFPFCKELLDKYENDQRVERICGRNLLGEYECEGAYFFSRYGNSHGWATWRRVAESWDTDYDFLNHPQAMEQLIKVYREDKVSKDISRRLIREKKEGIPYWEMVVGIRTILQSGLVIYPSKNMISNTGLGANSTHSPESIKQLSQSAQKLFFAQTYDIEFPLKHPKYIYSDDQFFTKCRKVYCNHSLFSRILHMISTGDYKAAVKGLKRRFKK